MSYLQSALKVIERKEPEDIKPFPEEWISRFDETTLERLAIMTVDGGLTDSEALEAIDRKPHIRLVKKKALPQEPKAICQTPFRREPRKRGRNLSGLSKRQRQQIS